MIIVESKYNVSNNNIYNACIIASQYLTEAVEIDQSHILNIALVAILSSLICAKL